jgi:hypothetical protein
MFVLAQLRAFFGSQRSLASLRCKQIHPVASRLRIGIRRWLDEFRLAERVAEHLGNQPFPHYEPAPDVPGLLVRIEADGTRTVGRFVNRQFREVD